MFNFNYLMTIIIFVNSILEFSFCLIVYKIIIIIIIKFIVFLMQILMILYQFNLK